MRTSNTVRSASPTHRLFEQSVYVRASATAVERCLTDLELMHQWLNPALRCEPVGTWDTQVGAECRFTIQIPLVRPTLRSRVVEREPGLIVWAFEGFFVGRDRWECQPQIDGTLLLNRFEFEIPNALIAYGFDAFAASWTRADMDAQLRRLKRVAERLYRLGNG
ncbi:polyketide cyclase [Leptolyngbya valderiana BDU 20041]|nr:polyketide cyclase [Leptolyngbya valderiana BDU 20041]